jgi:hypothetical protein
MIKKKLIVGVAWVSAFFIARTLFRHFEMEGIFNFLILFIVVAEWPWQLLVRLFGYEAGHFFTPAVPRGRIPLDTTEECLKFYGTVTLRSTIWIVTYFVKAIIILLVVNGIANMFDRDR